MDGWQLRQLREDLDISLPQLAKELGYRWHGFLSEVETGKKPATAGHVRKVLVAVRRIHARREQCLRECLQERLQELSLLQ